MYRCSLLTLSLFNFHYLDISYTVKIEEDKNDLFCFKSDGLMDSLSTQVLRESISPSQHPIMIIIINSSSLSSSSTLPFLLSLLWLQWTMSYPKLHCSFILYTGRSVWGLRSCYYSKIAFPQPPPSSPWSWSSLVPGPGLRTSLITRRRVTVGQWTTCKHQQHQH